MENRRKSSSSYPRDPHEKNKKLAGEKGRHRRGRYGNDKQNEPRYWKRKSKQSKPSRKKPFKKQLPPITSDDQITDGRLRGRKLTLSPSPKMAPTSWKLRDILFRILYRRVRAKTFLDLCAGAGSVGIGAISRGAILATMVDRKARNCSLIQKNLQDLDIKEGHGEVFESEFAPFLKAAAKKRRYWDVVYFAPPYDCNYDEALECFKRGWGIKPGGILVIEHHAEMFFPEKLGVLKRWKVVVEDEAAMSFYDRIS